MSLDQAIREEARLIMLRALADEPDHRLNSSLLVQVLGNFAITRSRDWVHEELRRLADLGAVTIVEAGSVRVASLTEKGLDHVERRLVIEGVKRPGPRA
jgi:DNA-binding GntR family transcriptional regulator